ncbi:MAG: ABC transporter ATP-binding protein [Rhodothermales bacterium]
MPAIEVRNVRKTFGAMEAVAGLSLDVEKEELFGVIGPDGAGKTTLFRMLVTLLVPDGGTARVDGLDVVDDYRMLRTRLGYMPGQFSLYQDLSVEENLAFFARVFGTTIDANYEWIRPVYEPLEPFRKRRAGALSGGMKQKLALSCALIHRPKVLVLDEPTTGVDAVSRSEFWQNLSAVQSTGVTILVSTAYMDEAVQCDRVALMQNGSLLGVDRPQAIAASFERPLYGVRGRSRNELMAALRAHPKTHSVHPFGDAVHVAVSAPGPSPASMTGYLEARGLQGVTVEQIEPTIEDVFMERMQTTG